MVGGDLRARAADPRLRRLNITHLRADTPRTVPAGFTVFYYRGYLYLTTGLGEFRKVSHEKIPRQIPPLRKDGGD
jgi:hypothetical protein